MTVYFLHCPLHYEAWCMMMHFSDVGSCKKILRMLRRMNISVSYSLYKRV